MTVDRSQLVHAGLFTLRHIASAVVIFGVVGYIATPHAQTFIEQTVDERLTLLEMQMSDVRKASRDMQREQAVMGTKIENLEDVARDTKTDTRMILQSLQGMRRDMRDAE